MKKYLYSRVLLWASDRGSAGFTLDELKEAVSGDEEEWQWVQKMLLDKFEDMPLFILRSDEDGEDKYYLTSYGASAAIDYLSLRQARVSANRAFWFAGISLFIAALTLVITLCSTWIANKTLQISIDPQLEIFLKNEGSAEDEFNHFSLGIRNIGIFAVEELTVKFFSANVFQDCKNNGLGNSSGMKSGEEVSILAKGETVYIPVPSIAYSGDELSTLSLNIFYIQYKRMTDNRTYGERVDLVIDTSRPFDKKIYWDEEIPQSSEMINAMHCASKILLGHTVPEKGTIIYKPTLAK